MESELSLLESFEMFFLLGTDYEARVLWHIIHTYIIGTALLVRESRDRSLVVSLGIFFRRLPTEPYALESTQALKMSTRKTSGGKDGRCVGLTTLPPSCTDCLEILEPQPPGTARACSGLERESFFLYIISLFMYHIPTYLLSHWAFFLTCVYLFILSYILSFFRSSSLVCTKNHLTFLLLIYLLLVKM
jgi:hypothetical protein